MKFNFSRIFLLPVFIMITSCLPAQQDLHLIPTPKTVTQVQGSFLMEKGLTIRLENMGNEQNLFAANELSTEIRNGLGFALPVSSKNSRHTILMGLIVQGNSISKELEKLGLVLPEKANEEGYILHVAPGSVLLAAKSEEGLYYGVQTLKQLIRSNRVGNSIPCVTITDWPSLRYRGWMADISRGPIPTVDFVKECIRKLAEYKLNFFTLYTEHTFSLSKYPDLAPPGSFTAAEIAELTGFAERYHIDMVGNFQSFGHMEKILGNPFFAGLRESGNILNPADEATYKFLGDVYSEIVPAYKSKFFNINCDETFGLGEGKSKALADSIGIGGIYAYHINRIDKLMKPYGKRLMMWGDIAVNNKAIISQLPKDLVILSWGYGAEDSFDNAIIPFKNTGFDFMVAPGVSCWGEVWPDMTNAVINISNYVRDGAKLGAMGMLNTAWDDNGHNLFNYNWHGLIWGAECAWDPAPPSTRVQASKERTEKLKKFNGNFDALFFGHPGVTGQLMMIDSLRALKVRGMVGEGAFWENMLDFYPENTDREAAAGNKTVLNLAGKVLADLRQTFPLLKQNTVMVQGADLALNRILFTAKKNLARIDLFKAYQSGDPADTRLARQEISDLLPDLYTIKKEYVRLWKLENRPWWLDKNMEDYDKLARQMEDVDKVVFIEPQPVVIDGRRPVYLRSLFHDKTIVYTLDGTAPSVTSAVYSSPLMVEGKSVVRACVLENNGLGTVSEMGILVHKGIGSLMKLNSSYSTYNPAYAAGGDQALVDGLKGSSDFADGRWQGYQGQDLDIELDLKQVIPVKSVSADFLQSSDSWILLPKEMQVFSSVDGNSWTLLKSVDHDIPKDDLNLVIHSFKAEFDNLITRYLRIVAKNPGLLPAWHHAAGNPSFIFGDEIIIE